MVFAQSSNQTLHEMLVKLLNTQNPGVQAIGVSDEMQTRTHASDIADDFKWQK